MKMLKTILLWLLLGVIPVQGFAASAMALCEPSQQRMANYAVSSPSAHHHAVDDGGHDQHQHHAAAAMTHDDDGNGAGGHLLSQCAACATCSIGMLWLSPEVVNVPVSAVTSGSICYFAFHIPGVDPDRPDHPPRFFLA